MRLLRLAGVLVLGLIGLEAAMQLQGESFVGLVFGVASNTTDPEPELDVALVKQWLKSGQNDKIRDGLRQLVGRLGAVHKVAPELGAALEKAGDPERVMILSTLARARQGAAAAARDAARFATHPDGTVRSAALLAVSAAVENPAALLPDGRALVEGVRSEEWRVENCAEYAPEVTDRILRYMVEQRPDKTWTVNHNVRWLGPRRAAFVSWWIRTLGRGVSARERLDRVASAEFMGPPASAFVSSFLGDPEPHVRLRAALTQLITGAAGAGSPELKMVAEFLPRWAQGHDPESREGDRFEIPPKEGGYELTRGVFELMERRPELLTRFASVFVDRMDVSETGEKMQLVDALFKLGALKDFLPRVLAQMERTVARDDGYFWLDAAGRKCAELGRAGDAAIPILVRALDTRRQKNYRSSILWSLGLFGPRAAEALPRLRTLMFDPDRSTSFAAQHAIEQIETRGR